MTRGDLGRAAEIRPVHVRLAEERATVVKASTRDRLADALLVDAESLFDPEGKPLLSDRLLPEEGDCFRLPRNWANELAETHK